MLLKEKGRSAFYRGIARLVFSRDGPGWLRYQTPAGIAKVTATIVRMKNRTLKPMVI